MAKSTLSVGIGMSVSVAGKMTLGEVTDRSTYVAEGYSVIEWCVEDDNTEAYLLEEIYPGGIVKYFFTKWTDSDSVVLDSGMGLKAYMKASGLVPPSTLKVGDMQMMLQEKTEGDYQDDPGSSEKKTTWEYWNAAHTTNMAVEVWANGEIDVYMGSYIERQDIGLFKGAGGEKISAGSKLGTVVMVMFVVSAVFDGVVDEGATAVIALAGLGGFGYFAFKNLTCAIFGAAAVLGAYFLYGFFPPFSGIVGLSAFVAVPLILAKLLNGCGGPAPARRNLLWISTALPLAARGIQMYFTYAPVPHNFSQYFLALLPAVLGGIMASVVGLLLIGEDIPAAGGAR